MTGIDSWSTTAATNATADGGSINWAENQAPSTVNNTARQMCADQRAFANDLIWFQYGTGDQGAGNIAVPSVYSSGTAFTITGADVTTVYHAGRRVRAVGVSTGTIYGTISSSAYSGGATRTTVNVTWDSGSLSNETLVISLAQIPVTGVPVPLTGISGFAASVATFLGTPSSANLKAAVTDETGSGALVFATSPTLVTPILGTPTSGTLTSCTGLPIDTGVSGLGTGVATFLGTPSSANLIAAVTDETGTGALVFANTPTLVTPVLGVATATSINKLTLTAPASSAILTIADGKTLTASNTLTFAGTDGTTLTFQGTGTYVSRTSTDTLTNKTLTSPTITGGTLNGTLGATTPAAAIVTDLTVNGNTILGDASTDTLTQNCQAVSQPNLPMFHVWASGAQDNKTGNGTLYQLVFDAERFDQDSSVVNGLFTAKVAGKYLFTQHQSWTGLGADTTEFYMDFVLNATTPLGGSTGAPKRDLNGRVGGSLSTIIALTVGQTMACRCRITGLGADTADVFVDAASSYSSFEGVLLG